MNLKKILSAVLALVLMMSCAAFAEQSDADRIAELEAQVAELTAQLEQAQATIKAYEEERYVVTFDGGHVTLEECQTQYNQLVAMYEGYGYSVEGSEDYLRESVMQSLGERAIVLAKAKELGHDVIAEDVMASYEAEARGAYETNVQAYLPYFQADGVAEEEARQQVEEFLATNNYTYEGILTQMIDTHVNTAMYEAVTAGVALTEEDVQAAYDESVAEDEALYADDPYSYESTQSQGGTIYWNPEGYRAVKHVLVKFTDEQKMRTLLRLCVSSTISRQADETMASSPIAFSTSSLTNSPARMCSESNLARVFPDFAESFERKPLSISSLRSIL